VVGGGVIGLSCAWRLAADGHQVTVVAPDPGHDGASWVAAGMLAPITEAQYGEAPLTALLLAGAAEWKEFAADLEAASGLPVGYDETGTLTVALTASDRAAIDDMAAYQQALGGVAHRRSPTQCRALIPALTTACAGGIEVPGDHHVDNRALLTALVAAGRALGVDFVPGLVTEVEPGGGVMLADGGRIGSDVVVLAAGIGSAGIKGLAGAGLPEVRPVKGHILRLGQAGGGAPLLARTVRGLVRGRSVYLVPRPDGSIVVGATMEERGGETTVQAGAVHQLLDDARVLIPAIDELELLECAAGLRPATPDNRPCIGWTALPGVVVATGHFRNGILLAPLTAAAMAALVGGRPVPPLVEDLAPLVSESAAT
jgi:glycine oxidase